MSDPVTQAEIEDVLSSIRRLVSEDGRTAPAPTPIRETPKPTTRLVLTPALRVSEEATKPAVDIVNDGLAEQATQEALSDTQEVAAEAEVVPEGAEAEVLLAAAPVEEVDQANMNGQTVPEAPDAFTTADEVAGETVEAPQAEDTASEAAPWRDPEATLFQAAAAESADADDQDVSLQPDARLSEEALTANSERVSAVVQKIAELEAKVAHAKDQWEPDGSSSDPYAGTNIETLEWTDHIEDEAEEPLDEGSEDASDFDAQRLAEEAALDETLAAVDNLAAEESYLDEDSLRELVADIVRSELQGALGERITRNVRKLVRREIQRALAAQDLI